MKESLSGFNRKNIFTGLSCPNKSQACFIALLAVSLLFAVVRYRFVQTWATNDDVGLSLICSGNGWTSKPDPHLMFTNLAIGFLLSQLYEINRHVSWYACYMVLVNLLSILGLAYSLLCRRSIVTGLLVVSLMFCVIGLPNLCAMQFTTDSCILGLAGFAVILAWWEERMEGESKINQSSENGNREDVSSSVPLLCGTILLIFSSLVRYQSFLMICLLGALFFAIRLAPDYKKYLSAKYSRTFKLLCISAITTFMVATVAYLANIWSYDKTAGWKEFYPANSLIANFVDFGFGNNCSPELRQEAVAKAGWSDNDLSMLQNLFCYDSRLFSVEKMAIASNILRGTRHVTFADILHELHVDFTSLPMRPFVFSGVFLCLLHNSKLFRRWQFAVFFAACVSVAVGMLVGFKLAPHVYKGIAAFFIFVQLFWVNRETTLSFERSSLWKTSTVLAACLIFLCVIGAETFKNCRILSRAALHNNLRFKQSLAALHPTEEQLFVTWREFFPFEHILPFDDLYENLRHFHMLPLALRANSALVANISDRSHFPADDISQALLSENTFLCSCPELNLLLANYLKQHYNLNVEIATAKHDDSSCFSLYQVRNRN